MSMGCKFVCDRCRHEVEAWDDGNPYYFDEAGRKHYAYHPDPKRNRCVGNDSPHLCLACGDRFMIDSRAPVASCPACGSGSHVGVFHLEGRRCPYCEGGMFRKDPEWRAIS